MSPRRRRRGSAAIEFALLLPIVFSVFGSIIDLSLYVSRAHVIQRAARDAARVGSTTLESTAVHTGIGITTAATAQAKDALAAAGLPCAAGCTVTSSWNTVSATRVIQVHVRYPFVPAIGLLAVLPATVDAEFTMMTQQQS